MLPGSPVPGGSPSLAVTTTKRDAGVLVLTAVGEIDAATIGRFRTELTDACGTGDRVVLDLSRVGFLSCSGLRALEEAKAASADFSVVATTKLVLRILEVSGLGASLDVRRDVEEVLQ